jgi:hypothetical protein
MVDAGGSQIGSRKRAGSESLPLGYSIGDVEALLGIPCTLFTIALARQSFLGALLLTRFQVEGMPLDFLNDVLLLNLALETAQRAFQGFSILDVDFCQTRLTCLPNGRAVRVSVI